MADYSRINELYNSLDRLKQSGEDVVAEIRAEINNLELQLLKEDIFPNFMLELATRLSSLRCTVDFSFQFDGKGVIEYSFCKSGSMALVRDKTEAKSVSVSISNDGEIKSTQTNLRIEEYSKKSIVVYGETKPFASIFKKHGGYYNPYLSSGPGWIFSKRREEEIRQLISNLSKREATGLSPNSLSDRKGRGANVSGFLASETASGLDPKQFQRYLASIEKSHGGKYSTSSLYVYTRATDNEYMRSKVLKYHSSGILYNIIDFDTLLLLMEDIKNDMLANITSNAPLMAVKLYIQLLNEKNKLIQ